MLVSWDWLNQYVHPEVSPEVLADRLTMTGLNLEEFHDVAGDTCIDFEVTSNRPDCLGHLGIAREAAVVYDLPLTVPAANPVSGKTPVASVTSVTNECPDLCSQYHARVIRGVKVGPSPVWMQRRLQTVGIACINNIVDITNYVLLECGQPLHAFDMKALHGQRIVVRRAKTGEKLQAIDHKDYVLAPDMCVIADADRPVALAGVMGGGRYGNHRRHDRRADRSGLIRTPFHSQYVAPIEIAQRFVLPVRARARSAGAGLGQPSMLRIDSGTGRG